MGDSTHARGTERQVSCWEAQGNGPALGTAVRRGTEVVAANRAVAATLGRLAAPSPPDPWQHRRAQHDEPERNADRCCGTVESRQRSMCVAESENSYRFAGINPTWCGDLAEKQVLLTQVHLFESPVLCHKSQDSWRAGRAVAVLLMDHILHGPGFAADPKDTGCYRGEHG
jgi:hypothetical protein